MFRTLAAFLSLLPALSAEVIPMTLRQAVDTALKQNPDLKVMVNGGYYDIATPFYEGWYEDHHLQIPAKLQGNIEFHYYQSGHMVYAHPESLKAIHDDVSAFIGRTNNLGR